MRPLKNNQIRIKFRQYLRMFHVEHQITQPYLG